MTPTETDLQAVERHAAATTTPPAIRETLLELVAYCRAAKSQAFRVQVRSVMATRDIQGAGLPVNEIPDDAPQGGPLSAPARVSPPLHFMTDAKAAPYALCRKPLDFIPDGLTLSKDEVTCIDCLAELYGTVHPSGVGPISAAHPEVGNGHKEQP